MLNLYHKRQKLNKSVNNTIKKTDIGYNIIHTAGKS